MTGVGTIAAMRQVEALLAGTLGWRPTPLPAELTLVRGVWKGEPAVLEARAWTGEGIRYARAVELRCGDLQIANLMAMAEPARGGAVYGLDLVALSPATAIVAADVSPMSAATDLDRIVDALEGPDPGLSLPSAGPLPPWARAWFSRHHLFARVSPGDMAAVAARLRLLGTVFLRTLERDVDPASAHDARERQRAYNAAHLEEDRGLQLLGRIVPSDLAARILTEVMFPVQAGCA